ncbi:MAG TPA: HupE/UreJ family protein [Stellaceae bacterium]|nr:HupE/UreJ family protein [Stellaceae bacterium]
MSRPVLPAAALLTLAATAAEAHTGIGAAAGLAHGFAHPLGGIDHVLAMVTIGVFAAQLGRRALWLVPLSFIAVMTAGATVGMAGIGMPLVEIGMGLSVVILGLCVAGGYRMPVSAAMVMAGMFALFHGHEHGAAMPEVLSGLQYAGGFVLATAMLHAVGIAIGRAAGKLGDAFAARAMCATGSLIALAGIAFLAPRL